MLQLDTTALVGKGLHRECFVHPHDEGLCVKVVVAGDHNENLREAKYYSLLARRGIGWEMLTRFHGLVDTNLGQGAVFDLVRDSSGEVSRTLDYYLDSQALSSLHDEDLAQGLWALKQYLLANCIVTMTLKPKNILFQRRGNRPGRLVLVDNVGNSDFLPLSSYVAFLARRKIARKWRRLESLLREQYMPGNKAVARMIGDRARTVFSR